MTVNDLFIASLAGSCMPPLGVRGWLAWIQGAAGRGGAATVRGPDGQPLAEARDVIRFEQVPYPEVLFETRRP